MLHGDIKSEPSVTRWTGSQSSNRLDCETGVLLRAALAPVFRQSRTWPGLRRRLQGKGFDLGFYDGRLVLTETESGTRICSCKYLGYPLAALTEKLGRVRAKAPKGHDHFGQIVA